MKRVISLFLAAVLALGLVSCGGGGDSWQEQYDLGVRYLSEGNYEEAIVAFTAAIDIDPKRAEAYIGLADAYIATEDYDQAKAVLEDALEKVSEEQHLGDVILIPHLFGPGQYIGLDPKLFPQGEKPVLVVHKSHGLILSFPSQQLQNPHILPPSPIELLSLYKKMRAKARTNKQRDDLFLLVAPGRLLSGSFHQGFPPLCIAQTIQGNEGFFIWLQLAKGTWILSSLLRRPLGEPPIG